MLTQTGSERSGEAEQLTLAEVLRRWQDQAEGPQAALTALVLDEDGLTEAGRSMLRWLATHEARPRYDAASRKLCYRGRLVKRLARAGCSQVPVLLAFEDQGWPARIDDRWSRTPRRNPRRVCGRRSER